MIYRSHQNVMLPALGFGTWELKGETAREAVRDALAVGYRHVDTARAYENEEEVARGIAESGVDRDDIFLTSKLWRDMLRPDRVKAETENSLRALRTPYLDLLLIHWPNPEIPVADTLGVMSQLAAEGKIKHIGVSNFSVDLLREANLHAPIFTNQVEYHPFIDQSEMLAFARDENFLITAYSPLAGGRVFHDPEICAVAEHNGVDAAQVALRWLVQQRNVVTITRSSNPERRRRCFDIFDFDLTPEEMTRINALSRAGTTGMVAPKP